MNDKENSDTLTSLEASLTSSLEKKKSELTAMKGGVSATKEIIKQHKEFLEKSKLELKELVSKNNLNQEVAQYVSVWLSKTTKHIEEYLDMIKSARDMKSGEIIAIDNVLSSIQKPVVTQQAQTEVKPQAENVQSPVAVTSTETKESTEQKFFSTPGTEGSVEKQRKKRGRPDQVGKLGETVKRIKEAKLKKNQ